MNKYIVYALYKINSKMNNSLLSEIGVNIKLYLEQ